MSYANPQILESVVFNICHLPYNKNDQEPKNKPFEDTLGNCLFQDISV